MLNLRDNYIHNTHEHYLINEDNESEYHMKQYNNESKSSLSPIRQCKKHVEICLNNNLHLNHLTIINHTVTASPIPEVSHNHKDVVDNTHNNNECSDCSSDQCNNNNNNNEVKKQSNNTIESPDMYIKRTLNVDTQLPTTSTCLNVSQKEIINEEDNNIITRRNKKLPSGLFTFIALDSLDENIKFPKKLQNNSKTRKLPLMKMNSIQNKTKYTLCNPNNNNSNIIFNPCQNNCNDVLIVDDEQFNVTSLSNVLLNLNIASDKCYNGKECMDKIQKKINLKCKCERSMYKLILLDVLMPYMNGIDAARKIQELVNNGDIDNSIKIVFISACVDQLSDFDELQKQIPIVKEFCQKPVKRSKIEEVVEKYYNV
jgi:CheY-like chemotaxis protein